MIHHYAYCGISECQNGSKRIWGAATWVDAGGWTSTYLFWGSPNKPLIRKYISHNRMAKSDRLPERIKDKRKSWSSYKEIKDEDVKTVLPDIESHIGMYILARKLKFK